jgi:tetratricopeptide (TPR) repeat protein
VKPADLEAQVKAAWDFADPAASMARFEARATAADDPDERAVWRTQLARALGITGSYDEASAALDAVEGSSHGPHVQARIAIERGRILNSSGDSAASLPFFDQAYGLAGDAGSDGLAVDALHMSAIALGATGDPLGAIRANEAALELAEASDDPTARAWRASLLNNLGWTQHDRGDHADALGSFERALDLRRADGSSAEQILIAEWAIARTQRSLGRHEEALATQLRLATEPAGVEDGYVAEEIAANLTALGRADEAEPWAARARTLLAR